MIVLGASRGDTSWLSKSPLEARDCAEVPILNALDSAGSQEPQRGTLHMDCQEYHVSCRDSNMCPHTGTPLECWFSEYPCHSHPLSLSYSPWPLTLGLLSDLAERKQTHNTWPTGT